MKVHTNQAGLLCVGCQRIFNKYPGFSLPLRIWFESVQLKHPEAHISEAGRGRLAQVEKKAIGSSRAQYGESAHNWGAGIDIFCNLDPKDLYPKEWYAAVVAKDLPEYILWYGRSGAPYYELPHFELRDWSKLAKAGFLKLVEEVT